MDAIRNSNPNIHTESPKIKVIDNESGQCICQGRVCASKYTDGRFRIIDAYSTDGHHFFSTLSKKFTIAFTDDDDIIEYAESEKYTQVPWAQVQHMDSLDGVDIYREKGLDELDPEVAPLVHELNDNWHGLETQWSCCGHDKQPLFIKFVVSDFGTLRNIAIPFLANNSPLYLKFNIALWEKSVAPCTSFIGDPYQVFKDERILMKDDPIDYKFHLDMVLYSMDVGEEAYKNAQIYADMLRDIRAKRQIP